MSFSARLLWHCSNNYLHCSISGIEKHLDYLKDNNETTVWLSPIYKSNMADLGYDITDHKAVAPQLGTMSDFDDLRSAMHRKGGDNMLNILRIYFLSTWVIENSLLLSCL